MYSLYYFHSLFHLFHTPLPWQILFLSFTHTHFERITNTHTHWRWLRSACCSRQLAEGFPIQTAQTLRWQSCEGRWEIHRGERMGRVGRPRANPWAILGGWSRKQRAWEMGKGQIVLPLSTRMADIAFTITHIHAFGWAPTCKDTYTHAWIHACWELFYSMKDWPAPPHWGQPWRSPLNIFILIYFSSLVYRGQRLKTILRNVVSIKSFCILQHH